MGICGNVCCVVVVVEDSFFKPWSVVVCLCKRCDRCCVFCLFCEAWSCRCSCMGSVSVSACRCCMFVSCVYPYGRSILQIRSHDCFVGVMSVSFCFPHYFAVSAFIICRGLRACTEKL